MDRIVVKRRLLDMGLTLAELSHQTSIPYDRLIKILGRYRRARPEEVTAIASVLELPVRLLAAERQNPSSEGAPGLHVED